MPGEMEEEEKDKDEGAEDIKGLEADGGQRGKAQVICRNIHHATSFKRTDDDIHIDYATYVTSVGGVVGGLTVSPYFLIFDPIIDKNHDLTVGCIHNMYRMPRC